MIFKFRLSMFLFYIALLVLPKSNYRTALETKFCSDGLSIRLKRSLGMSYKEAVKELLQKE